MVVPVVARQNPAASVPDFRQVIALRVQFLNGPGDIGAGQHDPVELDLTVSGFVEFQPAGMTPLLQGGIGRTARRDKRDARRKGIALLPKRPGEKAPDRHLSRFPGKRVTAIVFIIDMLHIIAQHQLMRRARERDAAPVMMARPRMRRAVMRGAVVFPVKQIYRCPEKGAEITFLPGARAEPHSCRTVRKQLAEVESAESAHRIAAEDDPLRVNAVPFLRFQLRWMKN